MLGRWLVVLGIASACGGQLRARSPSPGADVLAAIRIEGNHAIETDALEPALALHEAVRDGATLDPYLLTVDADRIRAAYLRRGFFGVTVAARVEHGDDHTQVVVFTITEGRRAVTKVDITGLPPELPWSRARALVALPEGEPFDYDTYEAAKQPLTSLVANAGYAHVTVTGKVIADRDAATATAHYEIDPGVRCTFGAIRVAGPLEESLAAAVRARLPFAVGDRYVVLPLEDGSGFRLVLRTGATGDRYSMPALEAAQAELYDLGQFSMVRVGPDHESGVEGGGPVVDLAVELVLANRHEVHAGFGFGYEPATYEARLRGGGSLVPARLPLMTLAGDASVALTIPHDLDQGQLEPKIRGLLSLQYLDLLWPRLRGEVEAGADYQTVEAYTWKGEHVGLGLGSPLGARWLQLRVGWVLEHLTFSNPAPPLETETARDPNKAHDLGLDRTPLRGAYQASLVAELRDNPIEPRRGIYVDLRVTKGTRLAGGDLTYLQFTPELRWYVSLGGTVLAGRARAGAIFGKVPVTERYYSGGTSGQRGYSERRLSPIAIAKDGSSVVIGGAGLIETGVELRRQLGTLWSFPVGANLFLDGGEVTDSARDLDPEQLSWAIGTGVWIKPVGDLKIRIDVGYRLNHQSTDAGTFANIAPHIGVGEVY